MCRRFIDHNGTLCQDQESREWNDGRRESSSVERCRIGGGKWIDGSNQWLENEWCRWWEAELISYASGSLLYIPRSMSLCGVDTSRLLKLGVYGSEQETVKDKDRIEIQYSIPSHAQNRKTACWSYRKLLGSNTSRTAVKIAFDHTDMNTRYL